MLASAPNLVNNIAKVAACEGHDGPGVGAKWPASASLLHKMATGVARRAGRLPARGVVGRPALLRTVNQTRVWDVLRERREVTRPLLAEQTGLSRPTVSLLADSLVAAGVLQPVGPGPSRGGRRAELLRFQGGAAVAIGVAMATPDVRLVLVDLDGMVVGRATRRMADGTPGALVEAVASGVDELAALAAHPTPAGGESAGAPARTALGVGLGVTGAVDAERGIVRLSVPLGWRDVPLAQALRQRLALPVRLLNEYQASALAEHWFGAARDAERLVYIGIGTGIAAGIVLDGEIYPGTTGSAGELGHITVDPDGPPCACGNHGCLEAVAAGPAIVSQAVQRLKRGVPSRLAELAAGYPEGLSAGQIASAAATGDPLACAVLEEVGRPLGQVVAGVINVLNPDAVVVGGDAVHPHGPLLAAIRAEARRRALAHPFAAARILPASLGADTTAVGAACLILREAPQLIAASPPSSRLVPDAPPGPPTAGPEGEGMPRRRRPTRQVSRPLR
jgi:predicted NBD/HSP70 family sugar kinase